MTPFEKAGYTKETKFKVLVDYDELCKGDIVTIDKDRYSNGPRFIAEDGRRGFMWLPGTIGKRPELEVIHEEEEERKVTKYLFENKDKRAFKDCSDEEMRLIADAKVGKGACKRLDTDNRWIFSFNHLINVNAVYQVLAPKTIPNSIDWDQCPVWTKYCFTGGAGVSYISEYAVNDKRRWQGKVVCIDGFPFFKRGTVAPEDSLLVRPE